MEVDQTKETVNPVQILQASLKLKPDGVIGPITFGALRMRWNLTAIQLAHFLGQCEHETGGWTRWTENLNYSAQGLIRTFPRHYPDPELAKKHERKPSVIANHVYGNRMGNNQPNDGWTFRGRGAIQLTGRSNYTAFAQHLNDPSILTNPDQVATVFAFDAALWFFQRNWIWKHTTDLSIAAITRVSRAVNLGNASSQAVPNGLQDRINKTMSYSRFIT